MSDLLLNLSKRRAPSSALLTSLNKQRYLLNAILLKHNGQTRQIRESTTTFELRFRAKLITSSKICLAETNLAPQNRAKSDKTVPTLPTVLGSPERKYRPDSAMDVQSQLSKSNSQPTNRRFRETQINRQNAVKACTSNLPCSRA